MDWSWLTPPIAAALSGSATAIAAILGVVITGIINRRTARQQLNVQLEIATKQLESQERIAAAGRAEQRALALLAERRTAYLAATDAITDLYNRLRDVVDAVRRSADQVELEILLGAYAQSRLSLEDAAQRMMYVASPVVIDELEQVLGIAPTGYYLPHTAIDDAENRCDLVDKARRRFARVSHEEVIGSQMLAVTD